MLYGSEQDRGPQTAELQWIHCHRPATVELVNAGIPLSVRDMALLAKGRMSGRGMPVSPQVGDMISELGGSKLSWRLAWIPGLGCRGVSPSMWDPPTL